MARFNPKCFAQPDLLKKIQVRYFLELLSPHQAFLEAMGLHFPTNGNERLDYLKLAGILAQPDEAMDSNLVEALHVIGNLGTDESFDELLEIAKRNKVDTGDGEVTAIDLATRIWLAVPQALVQMERTRQCHRHRKFESFRAREPGEGTPVESLPSNLSGLEGDLSGWFESRKRGTGCKIIRRDGFGEIRFLIQHGQPCWRKTDNGVPGGWGNRFKNTWEPILVFGGLGCLGSLGFLGSLGPTEQTDGSPGRDDKGDDQRKAHGGRGSYGNRPHVRHHQPANESDGRLFDEIAARAKIAS